MGVIAYTTPKNKLFKIVHKNYLLELKLKYLINLRDFFSHASSFKRAH